MPDTHDVARTLVALRAAALRLTAADITAAERAALAERINSTARVLTALLRHTAIRQEWMP